jgi:hypothetical protein
MSKKAIIELELKADGYKADVAEIQKANTTISDSATKAANQATEAYTQTGKAAKAAFSSTEVQKALVDQNKSVNTLTASLDKLAKEEIELVNANKQATEAYKNNRAEAEKVRSQIAQLTKQTESYNKSNDNTEKKAKSLTGQLRAMKQELALLEQEGKDGTAQFQQLAIAAGRLEDQIGDTRERVRVLASDTFAFDVAIDATQTLAGAFGAVQGAVGLFAEDNEELQKTIAKTNSALALLNGLQQINAFVTGQSAARIALATTAQAAYTAVVGTSTGALKAFRLALAATGIGLIVIGLIALVQNFDKVKKAFSDFAELKPENTFLKIGKAIVDTALVPINLLIKGIEKVQNLIDPAKEVQKNKGVVEAFIKAEEKRVEARAAAIDRAIALAQAEGKETVNLEIEKEKLFLDFAKRKLKILTDNEKTIAQINKLTGQDLSDFQFDLQQEVLDRENNIKVLRIKNAREVKAAVDELEFKSLERRIKLTKEQEEALKFPTKLLIQSAETQIAILQNVNDTAIELGQNTLSRRIEQIRLEGEARKLAAIRSIDDQDEEATAIQLIEAQTQEAIRAERKRTLDESIQIAQEYVAVVANLASELNELSRINTETSINDINARRDAEIIAINQTLDTERDKIRQREAAELRANKKIGQEKQKQARRDKALALFQAGIDLATSIVKTGATLGYPAAIPFQITAGIVGAAQIAAIASQPIPKFEKGGMIRGKRHRDGGTIVEAEDQEFVVNRGQTRKHLEEVSAINRSTAEFHRLIERKYIQPRIASILSGTNRRSDKVVVNATLNARTMEGELKGLRKDIRRSASKGYKSNQTDTRYQWQRN